jgi:hypothetical protein
MSSRSLAAARSRRAGENAPPVSGNRPITSIGSQAAFAQQMPPNMGYNMPPPPNNVRTNRAPQQPNGKANNKYYQQYDQSQQQQQQQQNSLPFQKLSISDAIGLITLRLGRVEQWIIESDNDESNENSSYDKSGIPENHKIIDNSVFNSIINRLNSLEKTNITSQTDENNNKNIEEIKEFKEQIKNIGDVVSKHTIELSKYNEQIFKFNRELTETKDILKSFMIKYDSFADETSQNLKDYETALVDLEKRIIQETNDELKEEENEKEEEEEEEEEEEDNNNTISSTDLKNIIKKELSNI